MTVATPRSGFDLEYYLNRTAGEKTGGGYYLNAAQQGEPDGRWFGTGAEALGLRDGQVVRRDPYLAVYTMTDPLLLAKLKDPQGRLAKLIRSGKSEDEMLEDLFLATLSRLPMEQDRQAFAESRQRVRTRDAAMTDALWALINTREFILNH